MAKAAAIGILALSELPADDACPLFAGAKQRTAVPRADILEAEAQLDLEALSESAAESAPTHGSKSCTTSLKVMPRTGSPPMPTMVDWPIPAADSAEPTS